MRTLPTGGPPTAEDLDALASAAARAGVFCDFDGTLAPIVGDPADAAALDGVADVVAALARRFAVVAVVSGRPAAFLAAALGDPAGVRLVGLYGIESRRDGVTVVAPGAADAPAAVARAIARLRDELDGDVFIEDKGSSVAVHTRRARDPEAALARAEPVVRRIGMDTGLPIVRAGKLVIEIGPDVASGKGAAVAALIRDAGVRAGLMVGDDLGDVDAFAALDGLEPALRVAVAGDEAPSALIEAADRVVDGPDAVLAMLRRLASAADR